MAASRSHLDARTPLLMAVMTLAIYIGLAMVLSTALGLAGLALANSVAFSTEAIVMLAILRWRQII